MAATKDIEDAKTFKKRNIIMWALLPVFLIVEFSFWFNLVTVIGGAMLIIAPILICCAISVPIGIKVKEKKETKKLARTSPSP